MKIVFGRNEFKKLQCHIIWDSITESFPYEKIINMDPNFDALLDSITDLITDEVDSIR